MMFLSMMMTLAANNLHVGIFGGWNGFKFAVDKPEGMREERKKRRDEENKMQNTGIFGGELGWRIFVASKFFVDPTLSIGYTQKTLAEQGNEKYIFKQLPIHFLLKTGYAMNDALSLYGIVGGGVNVLWDNMENSKKSTHGDFTVGAGAAFYFAKYLSIFAEYRYARTFKKEKELALNSNRVVGGLQFNF